MRQRAAGGKGSGPRRRKAGVPPRRQRGGSGNCHAPSATCQWRSAATRRTAPSSHSAQCPAPNSLRLANHGRGIRPGRLAAHVQQPGRRSRDQREQGRPERRPRRVAQGHGFSCGSTRQRRCPQTRENDLGRRRPAPHARASSARAQRGGGGSMGSGGSCSARLERPWRLGHRSRGTISCSSPPKPTEVTRPAAAAAAAAAACRPPCCSPRPPPNTMLDAVALAVAALLIVAQVGFGLQCRWRNARRRTAAHATPTSATPPA